MLTITDPKATAEAFAKDYMASSFNQLANQKANLSFQKSALSSLSTAMETFQKLQRDLVSGGGMIQNSVTQSNPQFANVTATSSAKPGSYQFYVEQLATAQQQSATVPPGVAASGAGTLTLTLADGTEIPVDLSQAKDENGNISAAALARVINSSQGSDSAVRASVIGDKLVLTSAETGEDAAFSLDTSQVTNPALKNGFDAMTTITEAQNAVIWLGGKDKGERFEQPGNTLDGIEGLNITFNQAGASGTITVAADQEKTIESVKAFVDAYNTLMGALGDLTHSAMTPGEQSGPFSADAGVRSLVSQLKSELRKSVDGVNLFALGIDTDKKGKLNINEKRFESTMKSHPEQIEKLFGDQSNGLVGNLDKVLDSWLNESSGQLKSRNDSLGQTEKKLFAKDAELQRRYESVLKRYTDEFTKLQVLQQQMDNTLEQLKNMFATSKD